MTPAPPARHPCPQCGASVTLPADLRAPTFACGFCGTTLETARFAGSAAVSADALVGHLAAVAGSPTDPATAVRSAPKLEHGSAGFRELPCAACRAPLQVPLDVTVSRVRCDACGRDQPVADYVSDRERLEIDMARQQAENAALRRLKAEGAPCGRCGGRTPFASSGDVQITCAHCGATILLAEHVDPTAIARHRVAAGVYGIRDDLMAKHARESRRRDLLIASFVIGLIALLALVGVVTSLR